MLYSITLYRFYCVSLHHMRNTCVILTFLNDEGINYGNKYVKPNINLGTVLLEYKGIWSWAMGWKNRWFLGAQMGNKNLHCFNDLTWQILFKRVCILEFLCNWFNINISDDDVVVYIQSLNITQLVNGLMLDIS